MTVPSSWAVLGSLLVATAVFATPFYASATLVADTDSTGGNTVQAGVVDLKLAEVGPATRDSTTDESGVDTVTDTWEDRSHGALGTDNVSNTLELDNAASTIAVEAVNVTVSLAENDSGTDSGNGPNTSRTVRITAFSYDGSDLTDTELTDQNGNSRLDLEDLTIGSNVANLSSLPGIAAGGSAPLTIGLSGRADLIDGVGTGDGVDVAVEVRVHASGFTEIDRSTDNTIQYD